MAFSPIIFILIVCTIKINIQNNDTNTRLIFKKRVVLFPMIRISPKKAARSDVQITYYMLTTMYQELTFRKIHYLFFRFFGHIFLKNFFKKEAVQKSRQRKPK